MTNTTNPIDTNNSSILDEALLHSFFLKEATGFPSLESNNPNQQYLTLTVEAEPLIVMLTIDFERSPTNVVL